MADVVAENARRWWPLSRQNMEVVGAYMEALERVEDSMDDVKMLSGRIPVYAPGLVSEPLGTLMRESSGDGWVFVVGDVPPQGYEV